MSIAISGIINLDTSDIHMQEKVSFDVMKIFNDYKIGGKLGGNVSDKVFSNYSDLQDRQSILFEIMDTPLDNTAQELFLYDCNGEENSLENRMNKVQCILSKLFQNSHINSIILDINYLEGFNEEEITLKYTDFKKNILNFYEKDSIYIPIIKMILTK